MDFKFYREYNGKTYLELHDNHTMWNINKNFPWEVYEYQVRWACYEMEKHYKDLEIFLLGRSGRHVCVEDTPINRRRYQQLIEYATKLEQEIIDYFNNKYELDDEQVEV